MHVRIEREVTMGKRNLIKTGLAVAAAVVMMTGCGDSSTTEPTETTTAALAETEAAADGAVAELGEYKGLTLTVKRDEVEDSEVEEQIQSLAVQYPPEITDRAAKVGDTANIDYEGTKDGVSFAGGTAYAHDLELGSGTFIPGFEDGIVGMMPGEEKDLKLTFPEDYYNEDLAGEEVNFHVILNHVTNPEEIEIDDDLAKRVNYDKDATLDQLRDEIRGKLQINAEVHYYLEAAAELLEQVVATSTLTVDPEALETMQDDLEKEYSAQASVYGMTYKEFLSVFMNTTPEQVDIDAENSLKEEMVMNEIIKKENIQATDEQKEMVAKINNCRDVDQLVDRYGEEQAEKMYGMYAGTYFLIEHAVQE